MLTPVDIHYLVGLLSVPSGPENVEVVLGDLVDDAAAEEPRDVDVTITTRDKDGQIRAFHGIEVKDHTRPLDVTHVEQLCAKFKDMPGLTSHAIVSASGYTKPAIRKARYHGAVPWVFRPWDDPSKGFDHVQFPRDLPMEVRWFESAGQPHVTFRRADRVESGALDGSLLVRLQDGSENASFRTVADWAAHVVTSAINRIIGSEEFQPRLSQLTDGQIGTFESVGVTFDQHLIFGPPENSFAIDGAFVRGAIVCRTSTTKLDFRILVEEGEDVPFAGCGIAELPMGNLVALSTNSVTRAVHVLNVPLTNRLKKQIRLQKVK
jgi:hypothetical protein